MFDQRFPSGPLVDTPTFQNLRNRKSPAPPKLQINNVKTQHFGAPFRCYVSTHKKYYSFEEFAGLGDSFMQSFCTQFGQYASTWSKRTSITIFERIKPLFIFLINNKHSNPVIKNLITQLQTNHAEADRDSWETTLFLFKQYLFNTYGPKSSKANQCIQVVNRIMQKLSVAGVVPSVSMLKPTPNWKKTLKPKESLLEACSKLLDKKHAIDNSFLSFNNTEWEKHIRGLAYIQKTIPSDTDELISAFISGEKYILETLRSCAEKELIYWHEHWLYGQSLINKCTAPYEELKRTLDFHDPHNMQRKINQNHLFPDESEESFGHFLFFLKEQFLISNTLPSTTNTKRLLRILRNTFKHRIPPKRSRGSNSLQTLTAYFYAHPIAQVAAMTIIMIDTAMNVTSARIIPCLPLKASEFSGFKSIVTWKDRGKGALIVEDLPVNDGHKISSIKAYEMIRKMNKIALARYSATHDISGKLFFTIPNIISSAKVHTHATPFEDFNVSASWRTFLSLYDELQSLPIYPSQIRVSVLNVTNERGGLEAAQLKGKHFSSKTTDSHYLNKLPTHLIRIRKIQEFQRLFQAVAIHNIDDVLPKLQISKEDHDNAIAQAYRTGLGVACINPNGGYLNNNQEVAISESTCTSLGRCIDCKKMIIVADKHNITDMILFYNHLKAHQKSMTLGSERWLNVWYPWLVLTQEIISRLKKGPHASIYLEAKKEAASTSRKMPPLW